MLQDIMQRVNQPGAVRTPGAPSKKKKKRGIGRVIGQSAAILPVLVPVMIFTPVMKKALKDKGITPAKAPIDLVRQFYDNIVVPSKKKKGSLEENLVPVAAAGLAAIVKGILEYFKGLKEKREKAETQKAAGIAPTDPLTPGEAKLLAGAEAATDTAKDLATEEAQFQLGKYVPYLLAGIGVLVVLKIAKVF